MNASVAAHRTHRTPYERRWALGLLLGLASTTARAVEIQGFADVKLGLANEGADDQQGFAVGELDLFMAQPIADQFDSLVELEIEAAPDEGFKVDVERAQVGWTPSDRFNIQAGAFHSDLGYWNPTYHHEAHFQTTVDRPFIVDFEEDGGVLPEHFIGVMFEHRADTGSGRFRTALTVGNGSSISGEGLPPPAELDPGATGDLDWGKGGIMHAQYQSAHWVAGVFAYYSRLTIRDVAGVPDTTLDQLVPGAEIVFDVKRVMVLAEVYAWRNDPAGGSAAPEPSYGGYIQVAVPHLGITTPYVQATAMHRVDDPFFQALAKTAGADTDLAELNVGLRFDLNPKTSIKIEGERVAETDEEPEYEGVVQWTWQF
jgi:hypothetical protein